jgi:hypothetical protein
MAVSCSDRVEIEQPSLVVLIGGKNSGAEKDFSAAMSLCFPYNASGHDL